MAWLSEQLYSDHPIIYALLLCPQVKILDAMQDIYYGRVASPWALDVDDWTIDPHQVNCTISSESDLRCKLRCSLEHTPGCIISLRCNQVRLQFHVSCFVS